MKSPCNGGGNDPKRHLMPPINTSSVWLYLGELLVKRVPETPSSKQLRLLVTLHSLIVRPCCWRHYLLMSLNMVKSSCWPTRSFTPIEQPPWCWEILFHTTRREKYPSISPDINPVTYSISAFEIYWYINGTNVTEALNIFIGLKAHLNETHTWHC